jgi:hypothetical protein
LTDPREMLDVYDSTQVWVWDPDRPDDPQDPAAIAQLRQEQAVVLTAWNPGHERPTRAVNDAANERLHEVLRAMDHPVWVADGASLDGTFHEPGFCVWGGAIEVLLQIARDFGQYAVYLYRPDGSRETVWT